MSSPTHDEIRELLGAFALDAVSAEEAALVAAHLRDCAACADEVAGHHDVAAALAHSYDAPPDGLWSKILDEIDGDSVGASTALPDDLSRVLRLDDRRSAPGRGGGFRDRRWPVVAAAAAVVVALLAGVVYQQRARIDDLEKVVTPSMEDLAAAAVADPRSRTVELVGDTGMSVEVVLSADGHGYLMGESLPPLDDDRTYQMWGIVGSEVISLGVLGSRPGVSVFALPPGTNTLALTDEVSGGVVVSAQDPVAAGQVD